MHMRHAAVVAGLALGLMSGTAGAAPMTYDFVFTALTGQGVEPGSFSGAFEVNNGEIIGISGSGADIGTINNLSAPGSVSVDPTYPPNDNAFSATPPYLTFNGVTFGTTVYQNINLFYQGGDSYRAFSSINNLSDGTLSVALVSTVPLPASAPMFGAALMALGAVGYGVKRKKAAAAA